MMLGFRPIAEWNVTGGAQLNAAGEMPVERGMVLHIGNRKYVIQHNGFVTGIRDGVLVYADDDDEVEIPLFAHLIDGFA